MQIFFQQRLLLPALGLLLAVLLCSVFQNPTIHAADPAKGKKNPDAKKPNKSADPPVVVPQRPITIAKVNPATRDQVLASAARIDQMIEQDYSNHGIKPNAPLSDELFIRRVYLEVTGTIPTLNQLRGALSHKSTPNWRANLIDQLLNTDGYASHQYNFWADILRLRDEQLQKSVTAAPYNEYIRKSIESNKPYDKWVYEMLTAEGKALEEPAAGYLLRDANMPLDALNNTIRVFLGTQIGCAQCHDHPFDKWTQEQFYQMAAYTSRLSYKNADKEIQRASNELKQDLKKLEPMSGGAKFRSVLQGNAMILSDRGQPLRYPDELKSDAKKIVEPVAIFNKPAIETGAISQRVAMAKWLTSPENPRFALTIANRLWKQVFGVGQIEPVDDMKDETVAANPRLMSYLTNEMVRLKFDQKEYLRILLNTKTWQRAASSQEPALGQPYYFPGPILRRMTAEQAWDSFVTLAAFDDPNEFHKPPASLEVKLVNVDLTKVTAQQVSSRSEDYRAYSNGKSIKARMAKYDYKGLALVRASELPAPQPPGHFLRQFGQSDREQIEGSTLDGSVPQALQMFNGVITHMLLEPDSVLAKSVLRESDPASQVDVIFQSIYSRSATPEERKLTIDEVRKNGKAGYGHVIWALVNTPEFLFIQ